MNITIKNFDPVGQTPPEGRNDITGHLTDQLSWVPGKHQMRFGGKYRQAQLDEFYPRHAVGSFTFDGSRVGGSGYVGALADFLVGQTSAASITIGDPERQVFGNTWFLNAGDTWQLAPKLNLNYGVRHDDEGPLHNGNKDLSVFRPESYELPRPMVHEHFQRLAGECPGYLPWRPAVHGTCLGRYQWCRRRR